MREFLRRYNLLELARSIADKGFTPRRAEALLAIDDPQRHGHYLVIEGNRRLATLKLLTDSAKRKAVGAPKEWEELASSISPDELSEAPVLVYGSREALDSFLGFRHITGPKPWRPEAKARFIAKLLNEGESISAVARLIGSNQRTVRRFAEAHAIYTQALEADLQMDQVEAAFGVFYNSLDREGVRRFIGLGRQSDIKGLPHNPVPEGLLENLRSLIELLYGDTERRLEPVMKESRELAKLGEVLQDPEARAILLAERNLERAWHISGGGRNELLGQLLDIRSRLAEVNGKAIEYVGDDEIAERVRRIRDLAVNTAERYQVEDP